MDQQSVAETFHKFFDVSVASSQTQKNSVFSIRYRVYCDEFGFESIEEFPDQIEFDEYDPQSTHCLITHRPTGKPAGCVRMVPTYSTEVRDPLPFEKYCADSLDRDFLTQISPARETMCEISRLAVDGDFRKRAGERRNRCGITEEFQSTEEERRTFPLIAVSAFLASTALTNLTRRCDVFMMTEPFLPRLLERSGIVVRRAGKDVDYHGVRAPYYITADEAAKGLRGDLRDLYHLIFDQFQKDDHVMQLN
ncbi:MAG: PEP-CTERM/exosortase system-associated acyltransferase [Cellvibrionaceae bacterium]